MYSFANFIMFKALPDVVTAKTLIEAIGISISRTYVIMNEAEIPYMKFGKRKIMFREYFLQGLSGKRILTDIAEL